MQIFQAIILGVVEGITEFLPISSTAHLLLTTSLLGIPQTNFVKSFVIAIQLGAILAVLALYAKRCLRDWHTNARVLMAFIPTALIGFTLYSLIKNVLFENELIILSSLFLGGIFIILFEYSYSKKSNVGTELSQLSFTQAFLIGCAQSIAIIPGVSRAAATIIGGMALGLSRTAIVEFSFLLAIPTMAAATLYDLLKYGATFTSNELYILAIGFLISFISAIFAVKFLLNYVRNHSFVSFGVYRIILSLLFGLYWLF